ncbi:MAG: type II secretion system F family protein [Pseudomonadota bacterium]
MAVSTVETTRLQDFNWEGLNTKGKRIKGELRAASATAASAELRRQGVVPTRLRKRSRSALWETLNARPVTSKEITIFVRQLATMVSAGIPLVQSLDIVASGQSNKSMIKLVDKLRQFLEAGGTFANALREHPGHFDTLFCNLVEAGEQSGTLDALLGRIATYKERTESLKAKIRKAMVYPAAVILVAIAVTAIIMLFVIPEFEKLFVNFGTALPALTRTVVDASHFLAAKGWLIVLALIAITVAGVALWKRSKTFQRIVDRIMLRIPIIGPVLHKAAVARFSRTLATTFAAGIPIVESLDPVAGASGNTVVADATLRMKEEMTSGQSLVFTMRQERIFPQMLQQMAAVGEETGALDDMLNKVADFYEEEVDNAVDSLSSLLEPIILVVIGTIVGVLVVAMYLPIFNIGKAF